MSHLCSNTNMKLINDGLPEPIFLAIANDRYDSGKADYTPSSLNAPVHQRKLERENYDDLQETASSRVWALLGSAVHYMIELAGEKAKNYVCERRYYGTVDTKFGDFVIGAQIDIVDTVAKAIYDMKCTSVWGAVKDPKEEWVSQLNVGRWCYFKETGILLDSLHIVGIWRDWQKSKAGQGDYPSSQVGDITLPVWTLEETEKWIVERVEAHEAARNVDVSLVPVCSPSERWEKESKWAAWKKGLKRATKICDTKAEAMKVASTLDGGFIQERKGESTRCMSYCSVAHLCSFGKNLSESN